MAYLDHHDRKGFLGFFRELREGVRREGNVLFALIFKEIKKRSGSEGYGLYSLIVNILEPAMVVATLMVFFYFIRRTESGGVHIAIFIAVSYIPFGIIRRSLATIPKAVKNNSAFYAYQQVKPFDSILARFLLEITLMLVGGMLVLFMLWWFLGLHIRDDGLPQTLAILLGMMATGLGLSLFFGTYGTIYPAIMRAISIFSRGLLLLSCVIHPMRDLQIAAGGLLLWNPLAHMEELIRYYALGMKPYPGVTITYPVGFMLTVLFLGFIAYFANRKELLKR